MQLEHHRDATYEDLLAVPELHLGRDVVVPDLAGWRRGHSKEMPTTAWIGTSPDWVCELLSPSTETIDRGEKRAIHAKAAVSYPWHLDPRPKVLEVFSLKGSNWLLVFRPIHSIPAKLDQ